MFIIGVDYHPSFQQIALLDQETGEYGERRLNHSDGEAKKFYRDLKQRGISVRVGMEAADYSRWFERLLEKQGIEVCIGNAAKIKTPATEYGQERLKYIWIHVPLSHHGSKRSDPNLALGCSIIRNS